ncbi:MAG: AAA family ATPase [Opitutus sp.]
MSTTATIHRDLLTWFKDMPVWQNEAFRRITTKAQPDAQDVQDLVAFALAEHGLEEMPTPFPTKLTDCDLPTVPVPTGVSPPSLVALHSLENVNLLMSGQRISFGPGMTVIYGGNGAGKSGYARVLKKACRCNERAIEPVLKNVYQAVTGAVTAKLDLQNNGASETLSWADGAKANERLRYFAVFDSKAARWFISDRNEVPSPTVFATLETLGDLTKQVKERLARMAADVQPQVDALKLLIDETTIGKLVAQVSAQTLSQALEAALVWLEADEVRLVDLEKQSNTLKTSGPQVLRKQLQQRLARVRVLRTEILKVETVLAQAKITAIQNQGVLCRDLKSAKDLAAEKALGLSVLPGAGSAVWEELLKAAAAFYAAHVDETVPFPGPPQESSCVLCQQKLDDESHTRLASFWQFLKDTASVRLAEAEKRLGEQKEELDGITAEIPGNVTAIAAQLEEEFPEIWPEVSGFFSEFGALHSAILVGLNSGDWSALPKPPGSLIAKCDAAVTDILEQETKLGDPAQAAAATALLVSAVKELSSRKRATASKAEILSHREKLNRSHHLRTLSDGISTRSVSNKVGGLQKQYVTEAFLALLKSEAKTLGLKRAIPGLTPKTESGRTTHAITIEGVTQATPDSVFSEGERTALALAYFLVDIGSPNETPCAIFDDPVSSLDHRIRTKVVERLCALGTGRQVVVFTHDLPFYCELKEKATHAKVPLTIQSIETMGRNVGIVRSGDPVDAMSVSDRETLLKEYRAEAKKVEAAGAPEVFAMHAFRFYSRLRSTWERAVEELLFNKVVQRFEKEVRTMSLTGAVVDEEAIKNVFAAMTKCSGLIDGHDSAVALNADTPDCDDMAADLASLTKFRTDQIAKRNAQEKNLKHLKA